LATGTQTASMCAKKSLREPDRKSDARPIGAKAAERNTRLSRQSATADHKSNTKGFCPLLRSVRG
jgi:hypothetical protein